ncbi:MAG TPA: helix-hairpin-helix domain-containing protein, partial [Acidiphilium sp.]
GFEGVEDLASTPIEELADIEGFDEGIATELNRRAVVAIEKKATEMEQRRQELGVDDALTALDGLTAPMLVALGEAGVKTLDDLADLASDELIEIVGADALNEDAANAIIMAARAHWFEGDDNAG